MTSRMMIALAVVSIALGAAGANVKPRHQWNFDRTEWWHPNVAADFGTAEKKRGMGGWLAAGQGVDASAGLVANSGRIGSVTALPLPYEEFTLDMKFKLASPLDGKTVRGLWLYSWNGEGRGICNVDLTGDGRLRVAVERPAGKGGRRPAVDFKTASEPLKIKEGAYHSLRIAVARGGRLTAWLDGAAVLQKDGTPSLKELSTDPPAKGWFPVMYVGRADEGVRSNYLDGAIDDVAVYDVALGAPEAVRPAADYSKLVLPEFKSVAGGADVLVLDADGKAATGRFRVLDHEEGAFGAMKSADQKFLDASSTASVSLGTESIKVKILCPVPDGMAPVRSKSQIWSGDFVELFLRPDAKHPAFYVYAINSGGIGTGEKFWAAGTKVQGWKSKVKIAVDDIPGGFAVSLDIPFDEVFASALKPGDTFGINFRRHGATCSGGSVWSVAGGEFNNEFAFGTAVYGGAAAYFARKLETAEARGRKVAVDRADALAAVGRVFAPVREAVRAHGADTASFASLEAMFARLDRSLLNIALGGRPLLLFRPANAWSNLLDPDENSKPLETIRILAARNSRAVYAFAAANLCDEYLTGQMKIIDRCRGGFSKQRPAVMNGLGRHFTLRQGFHIASRDGRKLYDPVMELQMKNLLRLGQGEVVPVYLELDTHGLPAGRHYAQLWMRNATPGYPDVKVSVEVTVTDDDLSTIAVDKAGYDAIGDSFRKGQSACPGMVRFLVERGYNVIYVSDLEANLYPKMDKSGAWRVTEYDVLDRHIDAFLAAGLPKEKMKLWIYLGMEADKKLHREWTHAPTDKDGKIVPFATEKWGEAIRFMVRDVAAHLKGKYGVDKSRIYWYPVDEPNGDIDDASYKDTVARAYRAAKEIKAEDPANLTMTDPLPNFLESDKINKAMPKLAEVYDVIELYRPSVTEAKKQLVRSVNLKEVWTYHIIDKETPPTVHRGAVWKNLRDGFREINTYWHMTESAGNPFDSSDCSAPGRYADYCTLYVDWDLDSLLASRRQLAADMATEDAKVILFMRRKYKDDPATLGKVEAIVKEAADTGSMEAMDIAREKLLSLKP